jgi:hypothetical protein
MSSAFPERRLLFTFDDDWIILKWDEHAAYLGGLQRFEGTKAVDFFGLYMRAPCFIEVKDFRGYRIESKDRHKRGELAREVACKVRDTLAALSWACGREPLDAGELTLFLHAVVNRTEKVPVVLWMETDRPPEPALASTLAEDIKRELQWLHAKVMVTSRALAEHKPLHGLVVTSLP